MLETPAVGEVREEQEPVAAQLLGSLGERRRGALAVVVHLDTDPDVVDLHDHVQGLLGVLHRVGDQLRGQQARGVRDLVEAPPHQGPQHRPAGERHALRGGLEVGPQDLCHHEVAFCTHRTNHQHAQLQGALLRRGATPKRCGPAALRRAGRRSWLLGCARRPSGRSRGCSIGTFRRSGRGPVRARPAPSRAARAAR